MFEINVYSNFKKKHNSTKVPSGAGKRVYVDLKEVTSRENPTFLIDGIDLDVNYVKWDDHYYFVNDISLNNRYIYEVSCTQDVLATYRTEIAAYEAFVDRSEFMVASYLANGALSQLQRYEHTQKRSQLLPNTNIAGSYLLRVIGGNGLRTYALSESSLKNILDIAFSSDVKDWISDLGNSLVFSPLDKLISLKWTPFTVDSLTNTSAAEEIVYLGFYNTGVTAKPAKETLTIQGSITLPDRTYNDYRDFSSAWSTLTSYFPGVGIVDIDPLNLLKGINYSLYFDTLTGQCIYILSHADEVANEQGLITTLAGTLAADIQISSYTGNAAQFTSGIIGAAAGVIGAVAGGGPSSIAKGISSAMEVGTGVTSAISAVTKGNTATYGSVGNISSLKYFCQIVTTLSQIQSADDPRSVLGSPYYTKAVIGNLSGYVKVLNPSIEMDGLLDDKIQVNNMLAAGFYME